MMHDDATKQSGRTSSFSDREKGCRGHGRGGRETRPDNAAERGVPLVSLYKVKGAHFEHFAHFVSGSNHRVLVERYTSC
jgi:hypothetical protein